MSIQLALDGHSFSVTGILPEAVRISERKTASGKASRTGDHGNGCRSNRKGSLEGTGQRSPVDLGNEAIEADSAASAAPQPAAVPVEVLSPRTLLVPAELFDATQEYAAALLAAAGMPPQVDDAIVWSDPQTEIVAVMAAGWEAVATVRERFGGKAAFTTPLLQEMPADAPNAWMYRAGGLLYIKVYDAKLQMAEVLRAPTDDDVLCIVEQLGDAFAWETYALHLAGNGAGTLRKMLKNRFKTVVCE